MKVSEMRAELESYGLSTETFVEKSEFVNALEKARVERKKAKAKKEAKRNKKDTKDKGSGSSNKKATAVFKDYIAPPLKVENSQEALKILLCTANVGNAEPTLTSMENWIPPDGECSYVTALAGKEKQLTEGQFDMIIVGMQEATFKPRDDVVRRKTITPTTKPKKKTSKSTSTASGNSSDNSDDLSHSCSNHSDTVRFSAGHTTKYAFATIKEKDDLSQRHLELDNLTNVYSVDEDRTSSRSLGSALSPPKPRKSGMFSTLSSRFLGAQYDEATEPLRRGDIVSDHGSVVSGGSSRKSGSTRRSSNFSGSRYISSRSGKLGHSMKFSQDENSVENSSTIIRDLVQETLGDTYENLVLEKRGQMRLHIWVKKEKHDLFQDFTVKFENTGIGHLLPNKGGILCTLTFCRTRITILTAHLAAHEGESYYKARIANLREILRGAKTFMNYDTAITSHHMFVMGDLNFRTRLPPEDGHSGENGDVMAAAAAAAGSSDKETAKAMHIYNFDRVMGIIENEEWAKLYSYDELQAGIKNGDLLHGFKTLPCNFNPTFKMLREHGFQYKDQRIPSYTDRILFKSAEALDNHLIPLAYEPCPGFITSDHKPIRGAFTIVPNVTKEEADYLDRHHHHHQHHHHKQKEAEDKNFQPLRIIFKDMSCTDLPSMDVDGFSDPYLLFVWDDKHLMRDAHRIHEKSLFKKKKKWPKTKYIPKNLNPKWQDQEIHLILKEKPGNDSILFVTAYDYDMNTADDLMCTCPLNIKEMVRSEDIDLHADENNKKIMMLDRPMVKYGKECGRIKCTIEVKSYVVEDVDKQFLKKQVKNYAALVGLLNKD